MVPLGSCSIISVGVEGMMVRTIMVQQYVRTSTATSTTGASLGRERAIFMLCGLCDCAPTRESRASVKNTREVDIE